MYARELTEAADLNMEAVRNLQIVLLKAMSAGISTNDPGRRNCPDTGTTGVHNQKRHYIKIADRSTGRRL